MARVNPDYDFKHKDASLKSLNIIKKITVDLPITTQASSFTVEIYNEGGNYNSYFDYHDDIKIYLGYESEGTVGLFHGRIEKLKKGWKPSGSTITVSGRGMWTLMMEKFEVTAYASTELGDILKDLISNNVPGLTTVHVESTGITPDTEVIDHAFINDKVTEYCKKASFDAWVDFDDDLHFTGTPGANSVSLVAGENIQEIELGIDWKKIRNYIRCYGKKVEDVQLIKTEEDSVSQGKYGMVMKIIKNTSLDDTGLVQSIVDAALLEDKESEWGGMAVIPGDERIEPAKSITVTVSALGVNGSYKVRHVKHIFEPKGVGFQTTVMLVEEEIATAKFYKELYEKTGKTVDFANSGNYEESYVYKFTDDQDSLLTLNNCYTTNSTLLITDAGSEATCTLTTAIAGDANYAKCLPHISQQYEDANKFEVSNDGGSTWEQVFHNVEHAFASSSGDKNDFKFRITMGLFDIIEIASAGTDKIYGMFGDGTTEAWNFPVPDTNEEIWGLAYNSASDVLYETENSTGKIYQVDPKTGGSEIEKADLAIELGGCAWDGTNLFVADRTNNRISCRNSSNFANEDYSILVPPRLMIDGFEDGNYTENPTWTNVGTIGNEPEVQSAVKYSGQYALKLTSAAGGRGMVLAETSGSLTSWECWIRTTTTHGGYYVLWKAPYFISGECVAMAIQAGYFKYLVSWENWVNTWVTASMDTWYRFKIDYTPEASTVDFYVYDTDGNVVTSALGIGVTGFTIEQILLGSQYSNPHSVYFDNVSVGQGTPTIDLTGLTWDGSAFFVGDKAADRIYKIENTTCFDSTGVGGVYTVLAYDSWRSQAFDILSYPATILQVTLEIRKTGTPLGDFEVELYAADSNGKPTGAVLGHASIAPADVGTTMEYRTLTFDSPVNLSAETSSVETTYCIVFEDTNSNDTNVSGNCYQIMSTDDDVVPNWKSRISTDQGTSWGAETVKDLRYKLTGWMRTADFSFTNPYDLAYDGSDLRIAAGDGKIYRYTTAGAEIDNFTPPGGTPRGLDFKKDYDWSKIYTFGVYLK